jgi:hypothetical protein
LTDSKKFNRAGCDPVLAQKKNAKRAAIRILRVFDRLDLEKDTGMAALTSVLTIILCHCDRAGFEDRLRYINEALRESYARLGEPQSPQLH